MKLTPLQVVSLFIAGRPPLTRKISDMANYRDLQHIRNFIAFFSGHAPVAARAAHSGETESDQRECDWLRYLHVSV
jgi:hypothetical protein